LTPLEQNENIKDVQSTWNRPCRKRLRQIHRATLIGFEAATDLAIAACGGDVRAALKATIVANEFLESEVRELGQAVSHAYMRGRFKI
jgi:hypothetical protein